MGIIQPGLPLLLISRSTSYPPSTTNNQLTALGPPGLSTTDTIMITFGIVGTMITFSSIVFACFQYRRSTQGLDRGDEESTEMPHLSNTIPSPGTPNPLNMNLENEPNEPDEMEPGSRFTDGRVE